MKKTHFIMPVVILAVASLTLTAWSLDRTGEAEEPELKEITPFTYCCIAHKGPFTEIENIIGQLMLAIQSQNIAPGGPMIGIYYSHPEEVQPEELQWEIGFPITPQALVQSPLEKKQWTFTNVASALHVGPYEKTGETINEIFEWMKANQYAPAGPVAERYLDMAPSEVDPEKLRTEIWIPLQKIE